MDMKNPKYKNQGIHVDMVVFTVDDKKIKTLLVQRGRKPFVGEWILPGGAVYNDESVDFAAERELEEKTGLKDLYLEQLHTFGNPKRDPRKRMVSVAYLALVDKKKVSILQKTSKTLDAKWFDIKKLPDLAFDHKEIVRLAVKSLRKMLIYSNIAYTLLPCQFTLPELQGVYEIILGEKFDRRNFRRKFLNLGLIEATGKREEGMANRPANLYRFKAKKYKAVDIL
ncbi:MAG: NUDIX hydrolase [Patescibacteria group bacterium]|nr:NUDIX hydrolase [Patescibacteria group bacterium]